MAEKKTHIVALNKQRRTSTGVTSSHSGSFGPSGRVSQLLHAARNLFRDTPTDGCERRTLTLGKENRGTPREDPQ